MDEFLASLQVTLVTTRSYANFVESMIRMLKEKLRSCACGSCPSSPGTSCSLLW